MFSLLNNILNKPVFKSLYNRILTNEVLDSLEYPIEEMYLDIDIDLLEDAKTRCLFMGTNLTVDYITVTVNGDVIVNLNLLIKYAKENKLEELIIPEGITFLYFDPGYVYFNKKIVFPSTLRVLSPILLNNLDDNSLEVGSITMNYGEYCEFRILDFSKCKEIKIVLDNAFDNMKAEQIIFPESINKIYCTFDNNSTIKEVYINSYCNFVRGFSDNLIIKDNRVKYYQANDYFKCPKSLQRDLIIVPGGKIKGKLPYRVNKIYYPYSKKSIKDAVEKLESEYTGDLNSLLHDIREILVCKVYNIRLSNLYDSKLMPIYNNLVIENSAIIVSLLLSEYYLDKTNNNITDEFESLYRGLFSDLLIYYEEINAENEEKLFKEIYFYDVDKDIDEYPVRERNFELKYKDNLLSFSQELN